MSIVTLLVALVTNYHEPFSRGTGRVVSTIGEERTRV